MGDYKAGDLGQLLSSSKKDELGLFSKKDVDPRIEQNLESKKRKSEELEEKKVEEKEELERVEKNLVNEEERNARTIFVGNIPIENEKLKKVTKQIKSLFKQFGEIESVRLRSVPFGPSAIQTGSDYKTMRKVSSIKNKLDENAKVCNAYVVFKTKIEAEKAVEDGQNLSISKHLLRVDSCNKSSKQAEFDKRFTAFIGNIHFDASEQILRDYFETNIEDAVIKGVRLIRDKSTNKCKGIGYVCFENVDMLQSALALHEPKILNRPIRIQNCTKRKKDQPVKTKAKGKTKSFQGSKGDFSGAALRVKFKKNPNKSKINHKQKKQKK